MQEPAGTSAAKPGDGEPEDEAAAAGGTSASELAAQLDPDIERKRAAAAAAAWGGQPPQQPTDVESVPEAASAAGDSMQHEGSGSNVPDGKSLSSLSPAGAGGRAAAQKGGGPKVRVMCARGFGCG